VVSVITRYGQIRCQSQYRKFAPSKQHDASARIAKGFLRRETIYLFFELDIEFNNRVYKWEEIGFRNSQLLGAISSHLYTRLLNSMSSSKKRYIVSLRRNPLAMRAEASCCLLGANFSILEIDNETVQTGR